ncbi:TetR/AcrR family transcriptional regulator [Geodermatophilus poikilotrophus]|uniref:DNA-binding transcriptional regulator, AcrR family n=1 Tax=Geodermatophilus poikilotrophus TaxID=1333667 RepID=A0A1I0I7S6_9ACTN|nr:TetR family transcriptional regulator [Geodermatophilus poikilotrophus]SET92400.1 DNA-binding transcriptional regulator, AcrR family [Geodermatophilus poikilotrophus]
MSDVLDRRARKKAQTRALIRETAQALFAERGFEAITIADIAAAADVAVQTVFNHFPTKEDLFFDGHTPWVDGAAESVRSRAPGTTPLEALHAYLIERVAVHARQLATPDGRVFEATLEASPALRARERELQHEATARLADALFETWTAEGGAPAVPTDVRTAASVTAAVWLAAVRTLIVQHRQLLAGPAGALPADPEEGVALACSVAAQVFSGLSSTLPPPAAGRLRRTG